MCCERPTESSTNVFNTISLIDPNGSIIQSINNVNLIHASNCIESSCNNLSCYAIKTVIKHSKHCYLDVNNGMVIGQFCSYCFKLVTQCLSHSKTCTIDNCQVPFCAKNKAKLARLASNAIPDN